MTPEDFSDINRLMSGLQRPHDDMPLIESDVDPDPVTQFGKWMREALDAGLVFPNAMTLATASSDGRPNARIVLLKGFDERGFVFYSNYDSAKGKELAENPRAALVFYWLPLERQVRIRGAVERVTQDESRSYFETRPSGSRLGAWASRQSRVIPDRSVLDDSLAEMETRYPAGKIPLPPFWGGYRLAPEEIELWQGRRNRLHDRLRYRRGPANEWELERLSP